MPAALSVQRLVKQYRSGPWGRTEMVRALDGVSLSVAAGEIVAIAGPPASGKSTLLLCAAGLVRADAGSVSWFGTRIVGRSVPPGIAYGPQRSSYYSFLTVREALEYYATLHDLLAADRAAQVEYAVREVALTQHASRRVGCLAPALFQRLGLAQALIGSPRAILLDETLGEDLLGAADVRGILRRLSGKGVTMLITAPEATALRGVAHRVVRLSAGRVVSGIETAAFANVPPSHLERGRMLVN
jgi:ABC-type multidrug transport system ATPase subunit